MSIRYFEDVTVDDELEPVEQMPTEEKAIEFFGKDNPTNPAFQDAKIGKAQGFGGALVPGLLKIAWLTQYASAWAGTEATVKSIRVAYRRPDIAGKPLTLSGRVVDKREEGGENIVELEGVTLADGEPSVRGSVKIAMSSKPST